jgi:hypothetical protein
MYLKHYYEKAFDTIVSTKLFDLLEKVPFINNKPEYLFSDRKVKIDVGDRFQRV